MIVHFEELYNQAETLSSQIYKNLSIEELIKDINDLLQNYKEIDISTHPNEVKSSLKKRYLGEILFLITSISDRDKINVYAALKEEIALNKLEE